MTTAILLLHSELTSFRTRQLGEECRLLCRWLVRSFDQISVIRFRYSWECGMCCYNSIQHDIYHGELIDSPSLSRAGFRSCHRHPDPDTRSLCMYNPGGTRSNFCSLKSNLIRTSSRSECHTCRSQADAHSSQTKQEEGKAIFLPMVIRSSPDERGASPQTKAVVIHPKCIKVLPINANTSPIRRESMFCSIHLRMHLPTFR